MTKMNVFHYIMSSNDIRENNATWMCCAAMYVGASEPGPSWGAGAKIYDVEEWATYVVY